jgi:hypothetical protein
MGRPRKWESDAERMAASRGAQRLSFEKDLGEEAYVAQIRAEALAFSRSIGESDKPTKIGDNVFENRQRDRLKRAEAYARWRWAGYHAGEIASL